MFAGARRRLNPLSTSETFSAIFIMNSPEPFAGRQPEQSSFFMWMSRSDCRPKEATARLHLSVFVTRLSLIPTHWLSFDAYPRPSTETEQQVVAATGIRGSTFSLRLPPPLISCRLWLWRQLITAKMDFNAAMETFAEAWVAANTQTAVNSGEAQPQVTFSRPSPGPAPLSKYQLVPEHWHCLTHTYTSGPALALAHCFPVVRHTYPDTVHCAV